MAKEVNRLDGEGSSALHYAARDEQLDIAKTLVEIGAGPTKFMLNYCELWEYIYVDLACFWAIPKVVFHQGLKVTLSICRSWHTKQEKSNTAPCSG